MYKNFHQQQHYKWLCNFKVKEKNYDPIKLIHKSKHPMENSAKKKKKKDEDEEGNLIVTDRNLLALKFQFIMKIPPPQSHSLDDLKNAF